jgi:hypothetical protein
MIAVAVVTLIAIIGLENHHGHDLIKNAKITSLVSTLAYTRNSVAEFFKEYHYLPGDFPNPEKISSCANQKCWRGNGDGFLQQEESAHFFEQLWAGNASNPYVKNLAGSGKQIILFYHSGDGNLPYSHKATPHEKGHYMALIGNDIVDEKSPFLIPQEAMSLDVKLDDGLPGSGIITAAGRKECLKMGKDGLKIYNTKYKQACLFVYMNLSLEGL